MTQPSPPPTGPARRARITAWGRLRILFRHSRGFPFATNLSLVSVPIGLLAVIEGPEVSRAFTIVWHSPTPVYVWGVVLMLGGLNVAAGIARTTPSLERAGLAVLSVAYAFYGVSVLIGLGAGGLVTGPFFLVLALSCLQRGHIIMVAARVLSTATTVEAAREATEEVVHIREVQRPRLPETTAEAEGPPVNDAPRL